MLKVKYNTRIKTCLLFLSTSVGSSLCHFCITIRYTKKKKRRKRDLALKVRRRRGETGTKAVQYDKRHQSEMDHQKQDWKSQISVQSDFQSSDVFYAGRRVVLTDNTALQLNIQQIGVDRLKSCWYRTSFSDNQETERRAWSNSTPRQGTLLHQAALGNLFVRVAGKAAPC